MKPLRRIIGHLMGNKLPLRIKRLIFISSVFGNTTKETVNTETLKRLNLVMQLASSENALGFPVLLSHAIWRGKDVVYVNAEDILNSEKQSDFSKYIKQIVSSAPSWLKYDSEAGMEQDLKQMFLNLNIYGR